MSPGAIETSRHRLLPRAMSGGMAPWSLQSRVVFMAPVATKSSVDAGVWPATWDHVKLI